MRLTDHNIVNRRQFLKAAGMAAALRAASVDLATAQGRGVSLIMDPGDAVAKAAPSQWAAQELERALVARGVLVRRYEGAAQAPPGDICLAAGGPNAPESVQVLKSAGVRIPEVPEALGLVPGKVSGRQVLLACGYDTRGLVYALLDLADRVQNGADPLAALGIPTPDGRAAGQCRAQPGPSVRQRCGGQALVQRPRDVAPLPHHAGHAAFQPLQPEPRDRLRFSP